MYDEDLDATGAAFVDEVTRYCHIVRIVLGRMTPMLSSRTTYQRAAYMLAFSLGIAVSATARQPAAGATHWAKIDGYPGFQGWRDELQHMVDGDKRFAAGHLCVVVATGPAAPPDNRFTWAYVHWREKAQLRTFGQSDEAMSDMTEFKAPLDLHKDVVATERQVRGSTYRVTRTWLSDVLRHCAEKGTQLVLRRSR